MRVIDHKRVQQKLKKRPPKKPILFFAAVLVIIIGVVVFKNRSPSVNPASKEIAHSQNQIVQPKNKKGVLKNFTPEQFKDLYNSFAYPNTAPINEETPITNNAQADDKIRQIALQRGYRLRSAPVSDVFQPAGKGFKLQQRAAKPWLDMQAAAKKENIQLGLTAAFRSADEQKSIFIKKLSQLAIPTDAIASGAHDAQITQVLKTTAIPGYSRHHTGYTIDISCEDARGVLFEFSDCFAWLSKNNYENAKKHGWIPSYPKGSQNQGPEPESWEYVWVGADAVTE